ncbi:MAG TPA: sigma-70 family RNA polymerase sigma factor [Gemmatimonadaceae bacterium]|nr:sigma-70 family RNA polymerase sigma factor [Gemmatimonadaceae bacterium]
MDDDRRFKSEALRWIDDVHRFSLSLTRNQADADDLVQDTYLRAYRSWHTFERGTDARRWLLTICRNAFLRTCQRARYWAERDGDVASMGGADADAEQSVDERLLTRLDLGPAIWSALDRLTEPYRSVVVLVDLEDQSYETTAGMLGVPIGTVRSRLFRARRRLRRTLGIYARDAGFAIDCVGAEP